MPARLLLIEDDNSIARFVELALEELPRHDPTAPAVDMRLVRTLADARAALAIGGWQLVISDLMLPDGSAETLLTEGFALATGAPPWIVFSAGVHDDRHLALATRGVARTLRKPVTLAELLGTIAEVLRSVAPAPTTAQSSAVQDHFGSDRALFDSFRAGSIQRFADDLARGDAANAAADVAALHRVAHSLKAVLALIGEPDLAAQAGALEAAAAAWRAGEALPEGWAAIASGLQALGAHRQS